MPSPRLGILRYNHGVITIHTMNASHAINTSTLAELVNPLESYCWQDIRKRISYQDIEIRLNNAFNPPQYQQPSEKKLTQKEARLRHIEQIAWLVQHGSWQEHPLEIDVGIPSLCEPSWIVQDGNHRLAAAIMRWKIYQVDERLYCNVSGSLRHAEELGFEELEMYDQKLELS